MAASRYPRRRLSREARRALNLAALQIVAEGRGLSRDERIARGLTWEAAARKAGVSRRRLYQIAQALRNEALGRAAAS